MLHLNSKNSQIQQTYIEIKDLEFHSRSKNSLNKNFKTEKISLNSGKCIELYTCALTL